MGAISDDEYECFTCLKRFRGRVFNNSPEWERVHYGAEIPEVEIEDAWGLECYCSRSCQKARRAEVMAREDVPIRRPGIGPLEMCAKCLGPVDMTEFHLTYIEDETVDESTFVSRTVNLDYLAVVCRQCRPRALAESEALIAGTDLGLTAS
jgi:hypothetical protein